MQYNHKNYADLTRPFSCWVIYQSCPGMVLYLKTTPTRLHRPLANKCLVKCLPSFQPVKIVSKSRVVFQQYPALDDRCPPHVEPNDAVGCSELVSTDVLLITEVLRHNISTDGELSHHGVDKSLVALVLRCVSELHV